MQETMSAQDSVFVNGPLKIDFPAGCACLNGGAPGPDSYRVQAPVPDGPQRGQKVLTYTYITEHVWGSSFKSDGGLLRVFMATSAKTGIRTGRSPADPDPYRGPDTGCCGCNLP